MYTGVQPASTGHAELQAQCVAIGNGVDFRKVSQNPVLDASALPAGYSAVDFRDPKIWRENDKYYCAAGNRHETRQGSILLFESPDALHWTFVTELDSSDNEYYRYKAVVNGELDKKVKFDNVKEELPAGLYVNIEYDAETGFVTDYDAVGPEDDVDDDDFDYLNVTGVESQKAGVITFMVNKTENAKYYLADDAEIFVVKYKGGDFDEVVTVSAKTLANDYEKAAATVYGVKNADGDYTALYIAK